MRRTPQLVAASIALLAVVLAGCGPKLVEVKTGEKVVCTYGETLSSTVKTIEVPSDKAAGYKVTVKTILCDRHRKLEILYGKAQDQIKNGKLNEARATLTEVLAGDPAFRQALTQLNAINAGKTPAPDTGFVPGATVTTGGGASGGGGAGEPVPVGPIDSLKGFVPDSLPGYTALAPVIDVYSIAREYTPTAAGRVAGLVISVEQYKSPESAAAAIASGVKRDYPVKPSTVPVKSLKGYFGSDGRGFAVVAFNDGAVVVVVEGQAASGDAAALNGDLSAIANRIAR
jgi:hypothetical protein